MKHKHADLIKAWADGAEIQYIFQFDWVDDKVPVWHEHWVYRIKPAEKIDEKEPETKAKWYQKGVEAEREACVKICEEVLSEYYGSDLQSAAARCAYLISTRGEQDD